MKRVLKTSLLKSGEYECLFEHIGLLERASCREYGKTGNYASKYIASLMQFSKSSEWEVWEDGALSHFTKWHVKSWKSLGKKYSTLRTLWTRKNSKKSLEKNRRKKK